ncbi:hypothetical protein EJB05_49192, partial [Eragrostis curvula]
LVTTLSLIADLGSLPRWEELEERQLFDSRWRVVELGPTLDAKAGDGTATARQGPLAGDRRRQQGDFAMARGFAKMSSHKLVFTFSNAAGDALKFSAFS